MQTWSYASWGSLGRGSICDSGISASEAALGVGELGEPLRTVCSSCRHISTCGHCNEPLAICWENSHAPLDWSNSTQPSVPVKAATSTCTIPVEFLFGSKVASVTCKRRPPISRWLCERPTCANQNEHRIDKQPPNESKSSTEPSKYAAGTNEAIMKPYGSITLRGTNMRKGERNPASHLSLFSPKDFSPYTFHPQTFHPESFTHILLTRILFTRRLFNHILFPSRLFTRRLFTNIFIIYIFFTLRLFPTFHPQTFHPQTLHPQTLHPPSFTHIFLTHILFTQGCSTIYFSPTDFHP